VSAKRRIVYPRVETIFARKKNGQLYRHDFDASAPLIGEPDGSLRIPGRPEKWAVIDGEPWMVNAPVEKRRRRKAGRRRKAAKTKGRARAKRNHALAVYALANRPGEHEMARRRNKKGRFVKRNAVGGFGGRTRRRRRARVIRYRASLHMPKRRHGRRARRRGYRRNPPMMGGFLGRLVPPLEPVLMAVAGATVTRFVTNQVEGYFPNLTVTTDPATQLPVENKMGRMAIKIASALLTGLAGGMILGRARGSQLAAGGLVIVTDELVRAEILPRVGLSEYVEPYEVVGTYVDPREYGGGADPGGVPGQELLGDGYGGEDLAEFMDESPGEFLPGRLNPAERLN